jgi:hypothetical protein
MPKCGVVHPLTATNGSYPRTWYLPTKHINIHKTNVHIQCKGNLKTCMLSNGLWHLSVVYGYCYRRMCHLKFSVPLLNYAESVGNFTWLLPVRWDEYMWLESQPSPPLLLLQRWPSAQSFIQWGSLLPRRHNTLLQSFQILYASKVLLLQLPIKFHLLCMLSEAILNHFTWISYFLEPNMNFTLQVDCGSLQVYQSCTITNIETLLYLNIVGVHVTNMLVISTCNTVEVNQPQHTDSCKINFYIDMWLVPTISNYFLFWIYFNIWLCNITEQYVLAVRQLILIFFDSDNLPKCILRTLFTPQETIH